MDRDKKLIYSSEVQAYIPCYHGGNSVKGIRKDGGEVIISKGIKTVIKELLKERGLDIMAIRGNFAGTGGKTNLLPIPLGLHNVLIPVKVRKTIGVNDGAFAYIDLSSIDSVSGDKEALVVLRSGREISCLESARSVKKRMKLGETVGEKFSSRMLGEWSLKEGVGAVSAEYSSPATKGDLCMLAYEIMKLRSRIEERGEKK